MAIIDSRAGQRGTIRSPMGNMSRVYCINCGKPGGYVTEDTVDIIIYQCDDCYYTHGRIPGLQEIWNESLDKKLGGN